MLKKNSGKSKSSAPQNAVVAAAIQDHLLRSLAVGQSSISGGLKAISTVKQRKRGSNHLQPKTSVNSTGSASREVVITENTQNLSLAEKLGVFEGPKPNLTEEEWSAVKKSAASRGAFGDVCPICQECLGIRQEILLSCSHTFHRQCIASLERFAGRRVCPVCRQQSYEARVVYEASLLYRVTSAIRIQSWWRGCLARMEYRNLRKTIPPKDPRLRRKFYEEKLSEITDKLIESDVPDVNNFLFDLERSVERARRVYRQLDEKFEPSSGKLKPSVPADWEEIVEMALNREDDTCPICLGGLGVISASTESRAVMLLSCSHMFHSACLDSLEKFANQMIDETMEPTCPVTHSCPLCRAENYQKICIQTLFSS